MIPSKSLIWADLQRLFFAKTSLFETAKKKEMLTTI